MPKSKVQIVALVLNGTPGSKDFCQPFFEKADLIIAADGGANTVLACGFKPDYLVGDFDSISEESLDMLKNDSSVEVMEDLDQDSTDFEKALRLINKLRPKKLIILGAFGDELDHTFANFFTLLQINKEIETVLYDQKHEAYLVRDKLELTGKKDEIVSILPLGKVEGLTLKGLKWSLEDEQVTWGWLGIRNRMVGTRAEIRAKKGEVIVIKVNV